MIPITRELNVVHSAEPLKRRKMKLSEKNIEKAIPMFRDEFYSNKELAPIREYSTNARDAHVRKGIPQTPIQVTLPSKFDPIFRVRDFGMGLSEHELDTVYFEYCESTKRNTNDENGLWGLGSKSAFAYTDSFVVTTWCEGNKTVMNCTIDGNVDTIFQKPTTEPEGVEITVPIQLDDVDSFIATALNFYKYWDIRPTFTNVDQDTLDKYFSPIDTKPFLSGDNWDIRPSGNQGSEAVVLMGYVPYPIDWKQIKNKMEREVMDRIGGIFEFLEENLTTLKFPNGSLYFTPNRESLQYKDETLKAISDKLEQIYDCLLTLITDKVSKASNLWEAKIIYNTIFRKDLEGFDKDVFYGGNLNSVERLLEGAIKWNGITVDNGLFQGFDWWDKNVGKLTSNYCGRGYDVHKYVLQTFVKDEDKNNKIKLCRCHRKRNNKIIASPKSRVIIQDTDKASMSKNTAKYIFDTEGDDVHQVYVLNLFNPKVKDDLFKFYSFDSVPVTYISSISDAVKAHMKRNRAPRGSSGNSGGSGVQPLNCLYFTIEDRYDGNNIQQPRWYDETNNVRDITNGIYVKYQRGSITVGTHSFTDLNDAKGFIQSIYKLSVISGRKITKVYALNPRTIESKWFKQSKEDGNWTELIEVLKDDVTDFIDKDTMKKYLSYESSDIKIGSVLCKQLQPDIIKYSSDAYKYCELLDLIEQYKHMEYLFSTLNIENCNPTDKEQKQFNKIGNELEKRYPLIFRHDDSNSIINCDPKDKYNTLDDSKVQEIVDYINMVDSR